MSTSRLASRCTPRGPCHAHGQGSRCRYRLAPGRANPTAQLNLATMSQKSERSGRLHRVTARMAGPCADAQRSRHCSTVRSQTPQIGRWSNTYSFTMGLRRRQRSAEHVVDWRIAHVRFYLLSDCFGASSNAPTFSGHRAGRPLHYRPAGAHRHIQTAASGDCGEMPTQHTAANHSWVTACLRSSAVANSATAAR